MSYAPGVDIGTTFSAAAVYRQGRAEMVSLGYRSALVPSAVLIKPRGDPGGRRRHAPGPLRARAAGALLQAPHRRQRAADPGRQPSSSSSLTARLLRSVVDQVVEQRGEPPDRIASRPANWGPFKQDRFDQAIRLADLTDVIVLTEPEARRWPTPPSSGSTGRGRRVRPGRRHLRRHHAAAHRRPLHRDRRARGHRAAGRHRLRRRRVRARPPVALRGDRGARRRRPEDPWSITRLRNECIEAKEALSSDTQVSIPSCCRASTEVRLTRSEMEGMIRPSLDDSIASLRGPPSPPGSSPPTSTGCCWWAARPGSRWWRRWSARRSADRWRSTPTPSTPWPSAQPWWPAARASRAGPSAPPPPPPPGLVAPLVTPAASGRPNRPPSRAPMPSGAGNGTGSGSGPGTARAAGVAAAGLGGAGGAALAGSRPARERVGGPLGRRPRPLGLPAGPGCPRVPGGDQPFAFALPRPRPARGAANRRRQPAPARSTPKSRPPSRRRPRRPALRPTLGPRLRPAPPARPRRRLPTPAIRARLRRVPPLGTPAASPAAGAGGPSSGDARAPPRRPRHPRPAATAATAGRPLRPATGRAATAGRRHPGSEREGGGHPAGRTDDTQVQSGDTWRVPETSPSSTAQRRHLDVPGPDDRPRRAGPRTRRPASRHGPGRRRSRGRRRHRGGRRVARHRGPRRGRHVVVVPRLRPARPGPRWPGGGPAAPGGTDERGGRKALCPAAAIVAVVALGAGADPRLLGRR